MVNPGDAVAFKLSPSGVEGVCYVAEEGVSAESGERMFTGYLVFRGEIQTLSLYESDIVDVLLQQPAECWHCGRTWKALKPEATDVLECPSCGEPWEALDHVKPLSKGGPNWPSNIRPICNSCNAKKGSHWEGVRELGIFAARIGQPLRRIRVEIKPIEKEPGKEPERQPERETEKPKRREKVPA